MLASLESCVNLSDLGVFHESACRADVYALTALDAGRICKASVLSRRNESLETTVLETEDSHAVSVGAACDAASAEDALGSVAAKSRSELIVVSLGVNTLKSVLSCAGDLGNVEKLALAVLVTLLAVLVVVGEHKLY